MGYPIQPEDVPPPAPQPTHQRPTSDYESVLNTMRDIIEATVAAGTRISELEHENQRLRNENVALKARDVRSSSADLTFRALRLANVLRIPLFKNAQGAPAHPVVDGRQIGFDWSINDWMVAVVGELGELANVCKKLHRGDFGHARQPEMKRMVRQEIADVMIYLDLLAYRLDITLDNAVIETWNAKSAELGLPIRLGVSGPFRVDIDAAKAIPPGG